MDTTKSERYIVHSTGKKSRPVTRQQITDMCAAGRMSPDATVVAEGSTLHKTILVFLGESQASDAQPPRLTDETPTPRKRGWLSRAMMLMFAFMLLGNIYSMYQIHNLFSAQDSALTAQLGELREGLAQMAAIQQPPPPGAVQIDRDADDPLARRAPAEQTEIRKIVSTINDYQQVLQELADEGAANSPAGQTADKSINRLMERLQTDFGIGAETAESPEQDGRKNDSLSASGR